MTSATKRFAATLGELTGGRVGLTCASGELGSGVRRRGVAPACPMRTARRAQEARQGRADGLPTCCLARARVQWGC